MPISPENQPTAAQLAHNDQVIADINTRLDSLIEVHQVAGEDDDMHPQVQLAGFATYLEKHSDATSMAQFLAVAIDRLLKAAHPADRATNARGDALMDAADEARKIANRLDAQTATLVGDERKYKIAASTGARLVAVKLVEMADRADQAATASRPYPTSTAEEATR